MPSENWRIRERFGPLKELERELKREVPKPGPVPHVMLPTRKSMRLATSEPSRNSGPLVRASRSEASSSIGARAVEMNTLAWSEESDLRDTLEKVYDEYKSDPSFKKLRNESKLFVPGDGPSRNPAAMFIGEAPGAKEDELGKPFVGQSGNMLSSMLYEAKLKRSEVFITNVVKYRPRGNRKPTLEELWDSVTYLRREVKLVLPQGGLVVLLGSSALWVVDEERRVTHDHGTTFARGQWTFMPMYHPSYVLQNRAPRETYLEDFRKLRIALDGLSTSSGTAS